MIIVVIDTNIIIASLWNERSASGRIVDGCFRSLWRHYYTDAMKKETFLILKNIRAGERWQARVRDFYDRGCSVIGQKRLPRLEEDPEDTKYIECALTVNAHYIISNDRHLLDVKSSNGTTIIKPAYFIDECGDLGLLNPSLL